MTKQPWIFVRDKRRDYILGNLRAFVWCRDTLLSNDWDHSAEGYWFKHEQDALIFTLKWII